MNTSPGEIPWIVGVDEVGRGPIAGPVTIGVCMCHQDDLANVITRHSDVSDSKKISPKKRVVIADALRSDYAIRHAVASVHARVIDEIGISKALKQAVMKALQQLEIDPAQTRVLLDGRLYAPKKYVHQKTIVRGDQSEWVIGAASILAKVHRDQKMVQYAKKYPQYGFDSHKGYGTKQHYEKLTEHGLSPLHRRSFLKKKRAQ